MSERGGQRLTDEQRVDWLRLIRTENVGPRGIMAQTPPDALRRRVTSLLGPAPALIDDLVREANAPPGAVQIVLFELELAGRLERHGNGLVSLL